MPPLTDVDLASLIGDVAAGLERGAFARAGPVELHGERFADATRIARIVLTDAEDLSQLATRGEYVRPERWDGIAEELRQLVAVLKRADPLT